ncbi:MAG: DUF4390 domain-containing protein [Syntrophaceae bacterium]|nr:DUF4390 domain-containing protein [Syntrophaceae bacterium]
MKKVKNGLFIIVALLLCLCLVSCAKKGQIGDIMVMDDTKTVVVFARLQDLVKDDTEKMIYAGVPVACTFYLKFYQVRPYWFDRRLAQLVVRNAIKYDNVKKKIFVTTWLNGKKTGMTEFEDIGTAEAALFDLNGVSLANARLMSRNEDYYVAIKARIEKDEHSHFVRYILLFLPFTDKETDWYRKEFIWKD